jgi:hypothetical protein
MTEQLTTSYREQSRGLAGRVLPWFDMCPDEELSASDIAVKFGVPLKVVSPSLRASVEASHLVREFRPSVSGGTRTGHYRRGPARDLPYQATRGTPNQPAPDDSAHFHQDGMALMVRADAVCISAEGRTVQLKPQQAALAARVLSALLLQGAAT